MIQGTNTARTHFTACYTSSTPDGNSHQWVFHALQNKHLEDLDIYIRITSNFNTLIFSRFVCLIQGPIIPVTGYYMILNQCQTDNQFGEGCRRNKVQLCCSVQMFPGQSWEPNLAPITHCPPGQSLQRAKK